MRNILYIVLVLISLAIVGFFVAFNHYVLDQYEKMDSPYDLNEEYNTILKSKAIINIMAYLGVSKDSGILKNIVKKQKQAYENAIKILPEEDLEKTIWEINYRYDFLRNSLKDNKYHLLTYFDELVSKKAKGRFMDSVLRYEKLSLITNQIINNKTTLSKNERAKVIDGIDEILTNLRMTNFDKDYEKILDTKSVKMTPLRLSYRGFLLLITDSFYKNYECPERAEMLEKYKKSINYHINYYEIRFKNEEILQVKNFIKKEFESTVNKIREIIDDCYSYKSEDAIMFTPNKK